MTDEKNMKIISSRKQSAWLSGCPIRITEVKLCVSDENELYLGISSVPCTDRKIDSYSVNIEFYNSSRKLICEEILTGLNIGYSSAKTEQSDAAYAVAIINRVNYSDGGCWERVPTDSLAELPEQKIIWQTDPLYSVIKTVCRGKTEAKYYPDEIDCGWRCTCGGINVSESRSCAGCGVAKSWLDSSFDREYLESQKKTVEEGKKPTPVNRVKKKEAEKAISDKTKMTLILATLIIVVILTMLSVVYIIPQSRYNKAHKLATLGEYDRSIEIFQDLGNFKNSKELVESFTYEKFVNLTGVSDLYITNSLEEPWFSISDDGVLTFVENKYDEDYTDLEIPHVVDGIVVRVLEKNIFLNATTLTEITIPDTVEVIGEQAFMNCTSLESIHFGKSLTTIMPRAFINCSSLETVTIHDGVRAVGHRAFNNCVNLKIIELGRGITSIEAYTFSNCISLEKIVISSPISHIGEYALSGCDSLTSIVCRFARSEWTEPTVAPDNAPYESVEIIFE